MKRGRPKGAHRTMISARLSDEAIDFINRAHNYYGVNKSAFIDNSIKYYYTNFSKMYIKKYTENDGK